MRPANLQTEWARLLLASLYQAGVRDVVVSPGARSTPFTWAALQERGLRCRTIIDERSAAFFALGHARITGAPVLLICTSGSAAANYFPAVVEAAESATPLLLLTADRGLELQHAASPQTIDQTRLYGRYAREYFELGTADPNPGMLRGLQRLAAQAVLASRAPVPGPVHLNARARKPLEPQTGSGEAAERLRAQVDELIARGVAAAFPPDAGPAADAVAAVARACARARRGLIVCGPASPCDAPEPADVAALARATGFAVVAEPASQQRFAAALAPEHWVDAFATLLAAPSFRKAYGPDLVLQLGRPPTASEWNAYLDQWPEAERYVVSPHGWPDPWSTATAVIRTPIGPAIRALVDALANMLANGGPDGGPDGGPGGGPDGGPDGGPAAVARESWLRRLQEANRTAWSLVDAALGQGFSEGSAIRAVVDAVPVGSVLALGNSLPIREVEVFVPARARSLTVWTQRGANGIDGLISGAAGAATAAARPTTLIVGDVSFAHDIGGLAAARDAGAPLTIVVLNNGGGRIFDRLPLSDHLSAGDLLAWLTPPAMDMAATAAGFGVGYARASTAADLAAALADAAAEGGTRIIEVVIAGDGTTAHQRELSRRLDAELSG
jgi:2-succinyl-5-enolpyruvyl-6-hydroxy-3-cyclohexene-1-carboxylate synthase